MDQLNVGPEGFGKVIQTVRSEIVELEGKLKACNENMDVLCKVVTEAGKRKRQTTADAAREKHAKNQRNERNIGDSSGTSS